MSRKALPYSFDVKSSTRRSKPTSASGANVRAVTSCPYANPRQSEGNRRRIESGSDGRATQAAVGTGAHRNIEHLEPQSGCASLQPNGREGAEFALPGPELCWVPNIAYTVLTHEEVRMNRDVFMCKTYLAHEASMRGTPPSSSLSIHSQSGNGHMCSTPGKP